MLIFRFIPEPFSFLHKIKLHFIQYSITFNKIIDKIAFINIELCLKSYIELPPLRTT